tara:strand:- start:445 stop:936 length:492 start_codon:yes stop_codon:yes gene_type:complete
VALPMRIFFYLTFSFLKELIMKKILLMLSLVFSISINAKPFSIDAFEMGSNCFELIKSLYDKQNDIDKASYCMYFSAGVIDGMKATLQYNEVHISSSQGTMHKEPLRACLIEKLNITNFAVEYYNHSRNDDLSIKKDLKGKSSFEVASKVLMSLMLKKEYSSC